MLESQRFRVLSLGGGTQSSALLLMSIRGLLPKLDAAIFADTQWEPKEVYETVGWLATQAGVAGIPVVQISKGNLRQHSIGEAGHGVRCASMPLYVVNPDGSHGRVNRQCTREYKVEPIELWIKRTLLGLKPRQRVPADIIVEKWFGMSSDEASRIRTPSEKWQEFAYPLCGIGPSGDLRLSRNFNRGATIEWLRVNYPGRTFPRSACIGCPFHSNYEWRRIKSDPETWGDAVRADNAVRHTVGIKGEAYLHRSCVPLQQANLGNGVDDEANLFNQECQGMCGI